MMHRTPSGVNLAHSPSARQAVLGGRRYENKRVDLRRRGERVAAHSSGDHETFDPTGSAQDVHSIISAVAQGRISIEEATRSIEGQCAADDLLAIESRKRVEVIDAVDMPTSQLAALLASLATKQHCAAARHVDSEVYATIRSMLPGVQYHAGARMLLYSDPKSMQANATKLPGHVAIVCGSNADVQMAYEAKVALQLQGGYSTMLRDISPTKLPELISRKEQLQAADAIIVCCGEQPALAGLILGLVDVPVVAIPGHADGPDPNLAVSVQGACTVAPRDGVSAANVAARTLHVAKQYIQHRKGREEAAKVHEPEPVSTDDDYLDRKPVTVSESVNNAAFDSAFMNGGHVNGNGSHGRVNGTAVNGVR